MAGSSNEALELFLRQLSTMNEFDQLQQKNWEHISSVFPGSTPFMCQRRYKEIKLEQEKEQLSAKSAKDKVVQGTPKQAPSKEAVRFLADSQHETKLERESPSAAVKSLPPSSASSGSTDLGPTMVIHVCDEAKNLKQDFYCQRDVLVKEMRYFAEYLSADAQRWEDVDISVHCDVQIFDWLMKFVKRATAESENVPKLEPANVISILISSDFLKMDALVQACIEFCHKNMSAILATPCNMNCINDSLVARIAEMFSLAEAEDIKDRKDKFKSKIFAKKLEKLFELPRRNNAAGGGDSIMRPAAGESAATLYKCKGCGRLLTESIDKKIKCSPSRMLVNRSGGVIYCHEKDPAWDVNDYLISVKNEVKTWHAVFWHVWGLINVLTCTRCEEVFQCSDLGNCLYHSEQATFQRDPFSGKMSGIIGTYSCCGQKALRFDPLQLPKGCKVRDHVVKVDDADTGPAKGTDVYHLMLARRDMVCSSKENAILAATTAEAFPTDVFANDEFACGLRDEGIGVAKQDSNFFRDTKAAQENKPRLEALTIEQEIEWSSADERERSDDDDDDQVSDEVGDDESIAKRTRRKPLGVRSKRKEKVTLDPAAILVDGPAFVGQKRNRWDTTKSLRFNQDAQRQEDVRRFREIVAYLTRLRLGSEKIDKYRQKEYAGGIYMRLEAQWRVNHLQSSKLASAAAAAAAASAAALRSKTRMSQIK